MAVFKKAERRRTYLKIGISGVSGGGKTYSSLLMARGLCNSWEEVGIICTENGSANLYAHLGDYNVLELEPPFTPNKYINGILAAEEAGIKCLVIDSATHAWAGQGGLLEQHSKATASKHKGNSYTAWREITPKHNELVDAMLQSKVHLITTMRSKQQHVVNTENGKTTVTKLGLAPVQRDGMEYEFTIMFDISSDHVVNASKDRTGLFDGQYFTPSIETGKTMLEWLNSGAEMKENKGTEGLREKINKQKETEDIIDYLKSEYKSCSDKKIQVDFRKKMKADGIKKFDEATVEQLRELKEYWNELTQ